VGVRRQRGGVPEPLDGLFAGLSALRIRGENTDHKRPHLVRIVHFHVTLDLSRGGRLCFSYFLFFRTLRTLFP
jgi:hypothetical protein